jgi:hypothetical protein
MAQRKESKQPKQTKKNVKVRDLKPKKDPKGAFNGNRQLSGGPRP